MTSDAASDKALALWLLDKMQHSETFLDMLRAARVRGENDPLDAPVIIAPHRGRMKKLFQGSEEEDYEVPRAVAAELTAIIARDLLSSREELIEKAIAAYIERHPAGARDLPQDWQTTIDTARAEVEGRTTGAFREGFVTDLAAEARREMERVRSSQGRDGRE